MRKFFGIFFLVILIAIFIYLCKNKSAIFYNNIGVDLYEKGSYEAAITYFKKSLAIRPKYYFTHLNLANAYKNIYFEDAAITEYKKCLQLNPGNNKAYKSLTKIYLQKQMYTEAVRQLKNGLSLNPANNEIKALLSEASLKADSDYSSKALNEFLSGNNKYAHELLDKAIALNAGSAYPHYLLAYFYYTEHKFNEAITKIEKILKIDPQFQPAHKLLGDIYFDNGDYLQAISQYKTALGIYRNDYILYNNTAIALVQLQRYHEAIAYIKKASELAPANPNVLYTLASIYRDNHMWEQALSEYDKLSDYPGVHNDKAGIYITQGKTKEASLEYNRQIQDCNRKLLVTPRDVSIFNNLANAYIGIKKYAEAEIAINNAINISPDYKQNYIALANIQKKLGKYANASKTLEKAYQLPDKPKLKILNGDISNIKNTAPQPFIENRTLIYLKNGRIFEGIIKSETVEKVVLEVEIGYSRGDMILYRNTIARIIKAKKGG